MTDIELMAEAIYLSEYPNGSYTKSTKLIRDKYDRMALAAINKSKLAEYMSSYYELHDGRLIEEEDNELWEELIR